MGSISHTVSKDKFQLHWKFKCETEVIKELKENLGEFLFMLRVGIDISKYNSNRIQNNTFGHIINKQNKPFQSAEQNILHKKKPGSNLEKNRLQFRSQSKGKGLISLVRKEFLETKKKRFKTQGSTKNMNKQFT